MLIKEKIINLLNLKDNNDSVIANFLLQDIKNIDKWTNEYVAKNSYTSKSSVTRFTKKLGYKSFSELVFNFKIELEGYILKDLRESNQIENTDNKVNFSEEKINLLYNMDLIKSKISSIFFDDLVEIVKSKKRIIVFTDDKSHFLANSILQGVALKNCNFQILSISNLTKKTITYFDKNDLFINVFLNKLQSENYVVLRLAIAKQIMMINIISDEVFFEESQKLITIKTNSGKTKFSDSYQFILVICLLEMIRCLFL